jgi:predicted TIM-barrel enzyme
MPLSRDEILACLRTKIAEGRPIIGGGAGTGISAKCEEAGGIDLIVVYNSGRYRMAGRGSLAGLMPFGNANEIVREMAREVVTAVLHTPVLAGVCATDPFLIRDQFLRELTQLGYAGIQNFPTVGLIDGNFRANLEETGMGYDREIECIAAAHRMDMLTTPYVFDASQAKLMTEAGADILVAHMGLTTSGSIGAQTAMTLEQCVQRVGEIAEAAKSIRPDVLVLCHGGRSPCPRMPSTCFVTSDRSMAFMALVRWSVCRSRLHSRLKLNSLSIYDVIKAGHALRSFGLGHPLPFCQSLELGFDM